MAAAPTQKMILDVSLRIVSSLFCLTPKRKGESPDDSINGRPAADAAA
jgi:hypothetical protein